MTVYCGIDPGLNGAIVALYDNEVVARTVMPILDKKTIDFDTVSNFLLELNINNDLKICIEEAFWMPRQKGADKRLRSFGRLEQVVHALKVPYAIIRAEDWRKTLKIPRNSKGDKAAQYKENKSCSIQFARKLFPNACLLVDGKLKPHGGIAEALLIAEYCRRFFS